MPTVAEPPDAELALRSRAGRVVVAATVAASAMASLDATIVNVALPHIADDLHAGVADLQWVLTSYLLALASLILLGGALGDRFGRRRVFVIGTSWFAAASLVCGIAPGIGVLIAARVLQGVGAALLTPGSLAILQASFRAGDRAAAVGAWSGLGGIAGALGPFLGGGLVDGPGWRWAFLLNLPIAAIAVVAARSCVPETSDDGAGPIDVRGATYAVAMLGAGTWALSEAGRHGASRSAVAAAAVASVVAAVGFVRHVRRSSHPLVPPALFRNRTFTVVNVGTLLLYACVGPTFFLVAYELQVVAGWSATAAGLALLPATLLMLGFSAPSGALAQRIGPRLQLGVGPVLTGAGLLLLSGIGVHPSWIGDVLPGAALFGLGLVVFVAPLTATVMATADQHHVGVASGVNNAIARAASLAALAALPVVSGLTAATGTGQVSDACGVALLVAAVVALAAGPIMFVGLDPRLRSPRTHRPVHCAVDGTVLQPERVPAGAGGAGVR